MKLFLVDTETTGLNAPECGLHQLAGRIIVNGEEKERFDYRIKPFPKDTISDKALSVSGIAREDLEGYDDPIEVRRKLDRMMCKYADRKYGSTDKFHFVAYNSDFDHKQIAAWAEKCGDKWFTYNWFWWPPLCIMKMAAMALIGERASMPDFKLHTVAKQLDVEFDLTQLHDAQYDIEVSLAVAQEASVRLLGSCALSEEFGVNFQKK